MDEQKLYVCVLAVDWDRNLFPDNKLGKCSECGEMVVFRPDSPENIPKICPKCVMKYFLEAKAKGEIIQTGVWNPKDIENALKRMSYMDKPNETKQ